MKQNTHEIFRKELELFDEEFPCPHHPAQCDGKCNDKLKSFLTSALLSQRASILAEVEGVIGEELEIQKKVHEKSKEIVAIRRARVAGMVAEKYTRIGKIDALSSLKEALLTLK